jgi:Flp pilus assembly protein TadG
VSGPDHPRAPRRPGFVRDEGGAYAIEFAFFGSLMVAVMLILIQYAVVHLARQNLNASLQVATRALLTGSFQSENGPTLTQAKVLENMRAMMCGGSGAPAVFFKCENLKIDVQVSTTSFDTNAWNASAVDPSTGNWSKSYGLTYQCPGSQSTAIVRAAVKLPIVAPLFLKLGMDGFKDGAVLLQAASVFRVEPFQKSLTGGC